MVKPFEETVNIQPQTIATGQPQALMSLSERLDSFASQSAQFVAEKQIQSASEAGLAAGIEQQQSGQDLALKEETFIGGISKKAFNQSAREGYLKSLDNDIVASFTELAANNPENVQSFNDGAESLANSFLENVDPQSKSAVSLSIDSMVSRYRPKIQAAQVQSIERQANEDQAINADERGRMAQSSAFDGDQEQVQYNTALAVDSINNRTDLNAPQKTAAIRGLMQDIAASSLSGDVERVFNEEGAQAALTRLDQQERPDIYTPEEWDSVVAREQKSINRKIARQGQELKANSEAVKLDLSIQRGALFADPAVPANPAKGSQDRKDVNNYYSDVSTGWQNLPIQDRVNLEVNFAKNTGIVPDPMIASANAAMRSGTVEQAGLMSDYLSRLQEEAPNTLKDVPDETRAISLQVSDAIKAGIDAERALEMAKKSTFGLTEAERTTISMQSQGFSKQLNSSLQDFVDSSESSGGFDKGVFYGVPDVSPAMLGEYRSSFDRFMQMTGGNTDQASTLAYQSIRGTWGVTETGGSKRFMKYAPETVYNVPNFGSGWVEDQFNEEMAAINAEGAKIAIDHTTAREEQPSYPVLATNPTTGLDEPLFDDNGNALRWRPNFKLTDQYQALVDAPGQKVEKAKKQRQVNMERRANTITNNVRSRVLNAQRIPIPFNKRKDFLKSVEGKREIDKAIAGLLSGEKITEEEAAQARLGFGL